MQRIEASPESIPLAEKALREGKVIAYPTETVYGLGADPFNAAALELLFEAKGRDRSNPVLLIVASVEQLERVVSTITPEMRALMAEFWPGPLSLVLPRHPALPTGITAGRDEVCVRCPGLAWARSLCDAFGGPITSTSANRSGEPPVHSLEALHLPEVSLGFDGGVLQNDLASTILDGKTGRILREGAVSRDRIESFMTTNAIRL